MYLNYSMKEQKHKEIRRADKYNKEYKERKYNSERKNKTSANFHNATYKSQISLISQSKDVALKQQRKFTLDEFYQ